MAGQQTLKRVNVYVNTDDLNRVAKELGCRPSDAIRQLIDNYLLAEEIDEVRRMPGRAPEQVFRKTPLPELTESEELEDGE